ncbi:MAG: hypothetical protein JWP61_2221 [Friedmanniella sp.]|nr:hypothetical protein [Friedmanniella sp.]
MFWSLAGVVLALAAFTVLLAGRTRFVAPPGPQVDRDQLRGFVWVGGAALAALALAVVVTGMLAPRSGRAEGLAVLGLFGYALYLTVAVLLVRHRARR